MNRPGCNSRFLCQPLYSSRHEIQRFTPLRRTMSPIGIVQAATVAVDEPASGVGHELAEGCHPVAQGHRRHRTAAAWVFSQTVNAGCGVMPAEV